MLEYDKIIFVCRSNTSRSPMAAAIFGNMEDNKEIEVVSRGSVVLFSEPINPKVEVVLKNNNLEVIRDKAKQLENKDIVENTLILTMSEQLKLEVMSNFENIENVHNLTEFVGEQGDVVDPYGGTLKEYEVCFTDLVRLVKKTVYKINEE
jgi:protein-tyrosine phosphatase